MLDPFEIDQFRKDIPLYRAVAGWTSEQLAERLEISRATLSKIETVDFHISVIQYYAILKVLEIEADSNGYLGYMLDLLIDENREHGEDEKHRFRTWMLDLLNGYRRKLGASELQKEVISYISNFINHRWCSICNHLYAGKENNDQN